MMPEARSSVRDVVWARLVVLLPCVLLAASPLGHYHLVPETFLALRNSAEFLSIAIYAVIFAVGWHTRADMLPGRTLVFSCICCGAALLDVFQFLSMHGVPDFITPNVHGKSMYFSMAGRSLLAIGLVLAALGWDWPVMPVRLRLLMLCSVLLYVISVLVLVLAFDPWLPRMVDAAMVMTPLKHQIDLGLLLVFLLVSLGLLLRLHSRTARSQEELAMLDASLMFAVSSFAIRLANGFEEVDRLLGSAYKAMACFFLYRAVFIDAIRRPYDDLLASRERLSQSEQHARYIAFHDDLTGLPNRSLLKERVQEAIHRAFSRHSQLAILYVDIDRFKVVNDSLGHDRGDELLKEIAARFASIMPPGAVLARMGGDEMCVLLEPVSDSSEPDALATRLRDALGVPIPLGPISHQVTISIGVSLFPGDGTSYEDLLKAADIAMYRAKAAGRNTMRLYRDSGGAVEVTRLQLERELAQALRMGEFEVFYQPRLHLQTKQVTAVEALIRWHHPERGLLLPADFIEFAEDSGQLNQIGSWVLQQACLELRRMNDTARTPCCMAVNVSVQQVLSGSLFAQVSDALERSGLAGELLELEISENVFMSYEVATQVMAQVRGLGVRWAIDDFGKRFSSLSYLQRLPVDVVKIDRTFIRELPDNTRDIALVRAIIAMCHALDLSVVAEGVENIAQLRCLADQDCDEWQGFLFSEPVDAVAVRRSLALREQSWPALNRQDAPASTGAVAADGAARRRSTAPEAAVGAADRAGRRGHVAPGDVVFSRDLQPDWDPPRLVAQGLVSARPLPVDADALPQLLGVLQEAMPFDVWMVIASERPLARVVAATGNSYHIQSGHIVRWSDLISARMLDGLGPQFAPCLQDIEAYRSAPICSRIPVGAYFGVPLISSSGRLLGALCAMDPAPQDSLAPAMVRQTLLVAQIISTTLQNQISG